MAQHENRLSDGMANIPTTPPTAVHMEFQALLNQFSELQADHRRLADEYRALPQNTGGSSGQGGDRNR